METEDSYPGNCSICTICCASSVNTVKIKVETNSDSDSDHQDDYKFVLNFLLATVLEIPQNEVVQQQEKLINQQLNCIFCESCTKLIYSAKQIYTQILELTRKFREIQKQIVEQISNSSVDLHHGTTLSTSRHEGLLEFCREFLSKNDFNGFGYPFIVNDIPTENWSPFSSSSKLIKFEDQDPPESKIKEEPISENDDTDGDACDDNDNDEDNYLAEDDLQNSNEDSKVESDSNLEPPPPPPKKASRKVATKKVPTPSSSMSTKKKGNRKSSSRSPKKKPIPPKKQSKFDLLYPNYPSRIRNPFTNKFHCLESPCLKMYPKKTELERHIIIEHLQDNFYKCEEPNCDKSFAKPEQFKDHVSWHAGVPRWKCQEKVTTDNTTPGGENLQQCTEQFFSRKKLTRHVEKVHQKDKQFNCEICGSNFTCKAYLTTHKYVKHSEKSKGKICNVKDKSGKFAYTPTPTTSPQICSYCGKSYSSKASLETHVNLVHEQTVGKFGCTFCERKFMISTHLKVHMFRKHKFSLDGYQPRPLKIEPFQCDVTRCRMTFVREETWRKHMEEKHGEGMEGVYEFSCKFCGKGFHLKWKLDYHEEAHENKESKPFSCEICGNKFARLPYLKMHKKNVHKIGSERPYGKLRKI